MCYRGRGSAVKRVFECEIGGSHSGVVEDSSLLGFDPSSWGE
jgi:hypothetical protein